ncbi:MAG: hypothetical protein HFI63_08845 [Lachnospiraceae bacterium]|nr:hypothetical protein [Lachnospiraceae bacterium]
MDKEAEQFLNFIRKQLYRRIHALARPLCELKDVLCTADALRTSCYPCRTDGRSIFWNLSDVVALLSENTASSANTAEALLLHQIIHCLFGHPFSMPLSCPPSTWNLACDLAAWHISGIWIPELLPDKIRKWLETVSRQIPDIPLYQARALAAGLADTAASFQTVLTEASGREHFFCDDHSLWPLFRQNHSTSPKQEGGGEGNGAGGRGASRAARSDLRKISPTEAGETETQLLWKRLKNQLTEKGAPLSPERTDASGRKNPFSLRSDGQKRSLSLTETRRHNYRNLLKSLASPGEELKLNEEEFQYAPYLYGLEHCNGIPLLEPLEYREVSKLRELAIVIDTSASCSQSLTQAFLEETRNLLLEADLFFHPFCLHILQCDKAVERDDRLTSLEDLDDYIDTLELCGMGGTDFCPAFSHIRSLQESGEFSDLAAILLFTDGLGLFPAKAPGVRTIFIFLKEQEQNAIDIPDWGEILILDGPPQR